MRWILFLFLGVYSVLAQSTDTQEIICLAKNIYHESRGESVLGQKLVAKVTLNRVNSPNYPKTICKVVYQVNQFSWTKNPRPITEHKAWQRALEIATLTLYFGYKELEHFNALYFSHKTITLDNLTLIRVVGNHKFYKNDYSKSY